jgi:CRISPR-associated endonuclease Csy4
MKYFIDIKLLSSKKMTVDRLLEKVYSRNHGILSKNNITNIAVSFPEQVVKLGSLFRIHGEKSDLEELSLKECLDDFKSNYYVSPIQAVPEGAMHRTVYRVQQNMTESKLRRLISRGSISKDEIKSYRMKMLKGGLAEGFIDLESRSTEQRYRHYIAFGELQDTEVKGEFNSFGLSKTATIPWF